MNMYKHKARAIPVTTLNYFDTHVHVLRISLEC